MESSKTFNQGCLVLSDNLQERSHDIDEVLEDFSSVVENIAGMSDSIADSDADSMGTVDYSVDCESDDDISEPNSLTVDSLSNTIRQSIDEDMDRFTEMDNASIGLPGNTEKQKETNTNSLEMSAERKESVGNTNYCGTFEPSYRKTVVKDKKEDSGDSTRNSYYSTRISSDSSGFIGDIHIQETQECTKQSDDLDTEVGHLKADNSQSELLDDMKERPRIILKLKTLEKVNPKRRPRKSTEPKRIIQQISDVQTVVGDINEIKFGNRKIHGNGSTVEPMLNYTSGEEQFSDNETEVIDDNELCGSDEDYVPDSISSIFKAGNVSDPNLKEKDRVVKLEIKRKRDRPYTPKAHGIDYPNPILVDSPNEEPPKLVLPCKICDKNCKNKASYVAHYKACSASPETKNIELVDGKHQCTICGRLYELKTSLHRHMRVHLGLDEYKCELCNKQFSDTKSLRGHILIHTGEKPYSCSFCGFKFRDKSTLHKHEVRHGTEKPFRCEVCGKHFFMGVDLRKHLKIHDVDREFKCDQCDKQFYLIAQLKRHYRVHTGERPFECQYCGKFFTDQTALKVHNAIHTGYKPFQCDLCGATFSWKCRLDKHIKRHNNDRPFECNTCHRRFIQKSDLTTHEKVHSGEKNYQCLRCGKTFADSSYLWKHKKTHSPIRDHLCSFCGKAFVTPFVLKRHWSTCKRKRMIETPEVSHRSLDSLEIMKSDDKLPPLTADRTVANENGVPDTVQNFISTAKSVAQNVVKNLEKEIEILINEPPEIPLKTFFNENFSAFSQTFRNEKLPIKVADINDLI